MLGRGLGPWGSTLFWLLLINPFPFPPSKEKLLGDVPMSKKWQKGSLNSEPSVKKICEIKSKNYRRSKLDRIFNWRQVHRCVNKLAREYPSSVLHFFISLPFSILSAISVSSSLHLSPHLHLPCHILLPRNLFLPLYHRIQKKIKKGSRSEQFDAFYLFLKTTPIIFFTWRKQKYLE